ncbi:nitrogen fixation protein [Tropicimonas sp. TH_r6]|uniref:NifB/NifX family molybdenum-iron cluster-binding protein n=1 Tax=Tropicimonas sp. TH_r6 TaxID=3082085 RepID=UPI0029540814|nr:nitrogen fixation protein [Tropicimonas sp. TH_r6]MDV7143151.1 nitrogen fixation protein [Tropicimonas sp. TH_r6]
MMIAIASQNFRTVTGHAGRTRRFFIFEALLGQAPRETDRLDLPKDMSIHEFRDGGMHPLDLVDVVIAGSVGKGFVRRMEARGITAVATSETDPAKAAADYLAGILAPGEPHEHAHGNGNGHGGGLDRLGSCSCRE